MLYFENYKGITNVKKEEIMTAKSSIHIDPGHDGYFAHNSRETFSVSQVFFDELNEISRSKEESFRVYHEELELRSDEYTKRVNQDLQKNAITHLSAIINLNVHHILDDLNPIVEHLEQELDTKVFQITVHRDEGKLIHKESGKKLVSGEDFFADPKDGKLYYDRKFKEPIDMDEWKLEKNYHAHIEMIGIDSEGYAIKRNRLHTYFLRNLQTFTANTLGMERGGYTPSYSREQVVEIRSKLKDRSEYENPKVYGIAFNKVARDLGYFIKKEKRLDTHDFKAKGKADNLRNDMLAEQKAISRQEIEQVKKRINEFVKNMRQQIQKIRRAKHEHYIKLEQASKDALAKITEQSETIIFERLELSADEILSLLDESETLKAEIAQYTETLIEKDAQIASYVIRLEEKNREIGVMKLEAVLAASTILELKEQEPEIKEVEVDKIVEAKITREQAYNYKIKLNGVSTTLEKGLHILINERNKLKEENKGLKAKSEIMPTQDILEKKNKLISSLTKEKEKLKDRKLTFFVDFIDGHGKTDQVELTVEEFKEQKEEEIDELKAEVKVLEEEKADFTDMFEQIARKFKMSYMGFMNYVFKNDNTETPTINPTIQGTLTGELEFEEDGLDTIGIPTSKKEGGIPSGGNKPSF